jgi:PAS domain S-box-containing protein
MEQPEPLKGEPLELRTPFTALMDALPDGVLVADPEGRIVFVNARLEKLSGYRRTDLIGSPLERLVPEILRQSHADLRRQFQSHPNLRPMGAGLDIHLRRRDGSLLPVDIQLSPVEVDDRTLSVAAVRDIGERQAAEQALRESEERYKTLVENAPLMVSTLSAGGVVTSLNKEFETITGFRREDWVGRHFTEILHPDDLSDTLRGIRPFVDQSGGVRVNRVRTRSGEYRTLEAVAVPQMSDGRMVGILSISRDVTESKQAEHDLRESEERFRKIFEHGPLGILLVDLAHVVIEANDAGCSLLGYSRDELLGAPLHSVMGPGDVDHAVVLIRELVGGNARSYQIETTWLTKAGRSVFGNLTLSVIRDEDGTALYSVHIIEDLTDRKAMQQELASHAAIAREELSAFTAREIEVLELLSEGLTAMQIADRRVVSVRTVESHLAAAYRKLGVRTKQDAVARFNRIRSLLSPVPRSGPRVPSNQ